MSESDLLSDRMNRLDREIHFAECFGERKAQVAALRERAGLWRKYARLLRTAGNEDSGALLAGMRDDQRADALEAKR